MFDTIKGYLATAAVVVGLVFAAVFKYRGNKIDELETVVNARERDIAVAAEVAKTVANNVEFAAMVNDDLKDTEVSNAKEVHTYSPGTTVTI